MSQKRVVIVGGGSGGANTARALAAKAPSAKVTLINPLPYLVYRPTLPRMTVHDSNDLVEKALIPYDKLFTTKNGEFVQGVVQTIEEGEKGGAGAVVLEDGKEIPYDVLVLAPGSHWDGPLNIPDDEAGVKAFISEGRTKFGRAEKIVLVGGGAVSLEFAGEIKDIWPKKEVTIVHGDNALLNPTYTNSYRKSVLSSVQSRGIKVVLDDFVDEVPAQGGPVKTRKGKSIDSDLVIVAKGPRPRTEFVAQSLGSSVLDSRGQIKVLPTLQLESHPNIFALGDAINTVEQKQVMKALAHSGIITANVAAYLANPGEAKLKPYKGSMEMLVLTNGKNGGRGFMGVLGGITLGDWFARSVKSKALFVPMARSQLGQA